MNTNKAEHNSCTESFFKIIKYDFKHVFLSVSKQADICHSYQILSKNGIPDEQIVVMMYDDIAYNEE